MLRVHVTDRQRVLTVPHAGWVRLLRLAAPRRWATAELSLALVESREMARLNRRHTGRRGDTDVLAFDLSGEAADRIAGEIIVNVSRAAREASSRGVAPEDELALYVVHGALHLLGYDDHRPADRCRMYRREGTILKQASILNTRPRRALTARSD